jgi:large subunit ribosomal protein L12
MEYIYAALLLHKLKREVTFENIINIIKATGENPDETRAKALIAALKEVNIDEALKNAVQSTTFVQPTTPVTKEPEKPIEKAEKTEEKKDEEALEGLSSLFG